jgi:hypothetical protein
VYENIWQPTLDIFLPVQMDHVAVNEAYRVWHGASHLDDALQAPVDHVHFDLYAQGPTTDTPYRPGEHIPGLNVGGWYDAGDYDIRTQSQYAVVNTLVNVWETFRLERDNTLSTTRASTWTFTYPTASPTCCNRSSTERWRCSPSTGPSGTPFPASSSPAWNSTRTWAMD